MASRSDSSLLFENLSSKITQLLYGRTKNDRILISKTLGDLNTINYKYGVVTNSTRAVLLINQCCSLILSEDLELVLKCCQLITNLVKKQNVCLEGRTLIIAVRWCLSALRGDPSDIDILVALDALLRNNPSLELLGEIMKCSLLMTSAKNLIIPELSLYALQCLEACTCPPEDLKESAVPNFHSELSVCFQTFSMHLWSPNFLPQTLPPLKTRIVCLRGLQNLTIHDSSLLDDEIGNVLGIIKSYMLLGIDNIEFIVPQKLMPSALSIPEPSPNMTREKTGGRVAKHRKYRTQNTANKVNRKETWNDDDGGVGGGFRGYSPANAVNLGPEDTQVSSANRLKTSDSDYSDSEAGNAARLRVMLGRVRQDALALFFRVVKVIKNTMFSYWSNFIPENPLSTKHNLMTCILKEPTTKGRMAALNVLLLMLATSKLYLAQAEKGDNLSFTPYSVALGLMIKELHKCLCLALNEHSIPVLNMVLKCLASLVQATPYYRLDSGLITKIVRNVKFLIYHRDPTVQVTAMIVLGCILATEPSIAETKDFLMKRDSGPHIKDSLVADSSDSIDFADFSSEDEEQDSSSESSHISWILARCIRILGVEIEGKKIKETTSMAVKLESLQIMSAIGKTHFETLMLPHLDIVTIALDVALADKYMDVRYHAGRGIEFIGQAISRSLSQTEVSHRTPHQGFNFWQTLLNGSLPLLLQDEQHPILRITGCDCLSNINVDIFEQLPRETQVFCITLLFACSRDEDSTVKAAAVRALAICVLHPTLREDLGFVIDTAEAILRVLEDKNLAVKTKCSWALGNLCEAIVLNKSNPKLIEELPRTFLLKLFKTTIKVSNEGLKLRINTVRALGHILQLMDDELIENEDFKKAIKDSMDLLVDSCTTSPNMKVRWNSCYAIGGAMNNAFLFRSTINWQEKVFNALSDLVINYRNFKVRIHAASALVAPKKREYYQQHYALVFMSLVKGLGTSQNMEDFSEYKHRDHLIEQICLTLGYLVTMLKTDDLSVLKDCIYSEDLSQHMKRLWDKLLPEKSTVLFDARTHVSTLLSAEDINNEHKATLEHLNKILAHDNSCV